MKRNDDRNEKKTKQMDCDSENIVCRYKLKQQMFYSNGPKTNTPKREKHTHTIVGAFLTKRSEISIYIGNFLNSSLMVILFLYI